jgi:hypothetical protein
MYQRLERDFVDVLPGIVFTPQLTRPALVNGAIGIVVAARGKW